MRLLGLLAAALLAFPAQAQDFPNRPLRFIVPYAPGALTDVLARALGDRLSAALKQPVLVEWQTFPDNREDSRFVEKLSSTLKDMGATQDAQLFFICRSGSRSRRAAQTMMAAGYASCINVADGFEGPLDTDHRRGRTGGWKAAGLPWAQG